MSEPDAEGLEERYEALELIIKRRDNGENWFEVIFDLITADCGGAENEPCTCGLESMGGSSGTLEQCYRFHGTADDIVQVKKADVLLVLAQLPTLSENVPELRAAVHRLSQECTWWEDTLARYSDEEEE